VINPANNLGIGGLSGVGGSTGSKPASGTAGGASFTDALKKSIDEVSRLQQDASKAVEDVASGKSENVDGVMTAMKNRTWHSRRFWLYEPS